MPPRWRLLEHDAEDGAWNMAVDRAVLLARQEHRVPPTLRLYRWRVPTVSLGKFQPADDVDAETCRGHGIDVVRRPTGGRGVLHDAELTYSVTAGVEDGVPRGTKASYAHLCAGLVEAYRLLGVDAELTSRERGEAAGGACYLHATRADLSFGAAKLSGSAQVWERDTVLQHGSFVLRRDVGLEGKVFRLGPEAVSRLVATTRTLSDILGEEPSPAVLRDAVVRGFERALGVEMVPGPLTEGETETARMLRAGFVIST